MRNMDIVILFDFYGDILSEGQRKIMDLTYNDDLSLSETALELGITRQGVRDSVKRSEEALIRMEEKLGLVARFRRMKEQRSEIAEALTQLMETLAPEKQKKLEKIRDSVLQLEL